MHALESFLDVRPHEVSPPRTVNRGFMSQQPLSQRTFHPNISSNVAHWTAVAMSTQYPILSCIATLCRPHNIWMFASMAHCPILLIHSICDGFLQAERLSRLALGVQRMQELTDFVGHALPLELRL